MDLLVRKQVDEIDASDFEKYPCWEYATDEEDTEGQDECTVRPLLQTKLATATDQVFIQAVFFFPNGRVRLGMVTLNAGEDPSGHQPVVFLSGGSLGFYEGAQEPDASAVKSFVAALREVCPNPFPIRYVSVLSGSDGVPLASGNLEGLYWLVNWRTGEICAVS